MATVLNRTTMEILYNEELDHFSLENWIIDPDLSTVQDIAKHYWKITGDVVSEMSAEEKAVVDAAELAEYKPKFIDQLWSVFNAYHISFYSNGVEAQMLELKLKGSTKAIDCQQWILTLWNDYYTRKYFVNIATTQTEVDAVSLDPSGHGNPPWTVEQLLQDTSP